MNWIALALLLNPGQAASQQSQGGGNSAGVVVKDHQKNVIALKAKADDLFINGAYEDCFFECWSWMDDPIYAGSFQRLAVESAMRSGKYALLVEGDRKLGVGNDPSDKLRKTYALLKLNRFEEARELKANLTHDQGELKKFKADFGSLKNIKNFEFAVLMSLAKSRGVSLGYAVDKTTPFFYTNLAKKAKPQNPLPYLFTALLRWTNGEPDKKAMETDYAQAWTRGGEDVQEFITTKATVYKLDLESIKGTEKP